MLRGDKNKMETKKQIKKTWEELKRRYSNIYIDLEIAQELNKKGVKLIA